MIFRLPFIIIGFLFYNTHGQSRYAKDFNFYWKTISEDFAYFDKQKTDWEKVKEIYGPIADTVTDNGSFIRLLESVNNELYNGHISLNTNLPSSNRLIPTGADLWITYEHGQYLISSLRKDHNAENAGLKPGMQITRFNRLPIDSAVKRFLPRSVVRYDKEMYEFAANMLLAGTHESKRIVTVNLNGIDKEFFPDSASILVGTTPELLV